MRRYFYLLLFAPVLAFAQTPLGIGGHEAFLGNTGVARVGSAAAAIYNPAGLATIESRQLSASGNLFQNSVQDVSGQVDGHSNTFQGIPTQLSTVGKWRNFHYAFSVFNIRYEDYQTGITANFANGLGTLPAEIKSTESSLLVGPSLAIPLREDLYVGASVFIQRDDFYNNIVLRYDTTAGGQEIHELSQLETQTTTYSLVPVLGITFRPTTDLVLGARVIGPSAPVTGHRNATSQTVGYRVNGGTTTDLGIPTASNGESAQGLRPLEFNLGGAKNLSPFVRVYVDLGLSFAMTYSPSRSSGDMDYAQCMSGSAGVEYTRPSATWAAGALYRQNMNRNQPGEVNHFKGFTVGYLTETEHMDTGLGLNYIFGDGASEMGTRRLANLGLMLTTSYKF